MSYSRARAAWHDYPNVTTPVLAAHLEQWDQAIDDLKTIYFNVEDYQAVGDGSTDSYAGIAAAATAAVATTAATLFLPPGRFLFSQQLAISVAAGRSLHIMGSGASTVLVPSFASGDAISVSGAGKLTVGNLAIEPSVTRSQSSYALTVSNTGGCTVTNLTVDATGGGGLKFDGVNYMVVANNRVRLSGSSSGVALRINACQGTPQVNGGRYETAAGVTGYTGCQPALYVSGTTTGLTFTGAKFAGAGPRSQWTVSSVTSDAAKFTVTTSAAHDFRVGDFVVLRGMTPAAYNSMWRVGTVPTTTTFTVTTTANSGTSSVNGTAESVTACAYVSNEDVGSPLSVNESFFTGCLFEASQTGLYGSAGLYFDGRRGTYPVGSQSGGLSGWDLTGNYYDQYAIGLLISGMASNSANETTANGFSVSGGTSNARGRAIHIDQVQAVSVTGFVGCVPGSVTPIDDGVSNSAGVYIYAGPAAPFTQGVNVASSMFGMGRNWQVTNNTPYKYGILVDSPGVNDLMVTGCQLFGSTAPMNGANAAATDAARRWRLDNNQTGSGTFPPALSTYIPTIASANAISLTTMANQEYIISGTTNIQTINAGWMGRRVTLMFTGALSLITGGNFAFAANRTILAGDMVVIEYDGTSWYVR